MTFHLQVRRAAELDIAEAKVWYETQRPGLGIQLQAEMSHVFSTLEQTPFIYPVVYRDVRRAIVHRFPYLVWYRYYLVSHPESFATPKVADLRLAVVFNTKSSEITLRGQIPNE